MEKITLLLERIKGKRVYIDTDIFVYFLDGNEVYFDKVLPLFQLFNDGLAFAYTGDAAVAKTLYKPYQMDDIVRVNEIKAFFGDDEFITILPHTTKMFELSAELAPKRKMKMIDALHYSTALLAGCEFILTNDDGFVSSAQIEVITLKSLCE